MSSAGSEKACSSTLATVRAAFHDTAPFNRYVGVELIAIDPRGSASARLPERAEVKGRVGRAHAAALFLVGQAASAAAFLGALLPDIGPVEFAEKSAEITYLGSSDGQVTAEARLEPEAGSVRAELRSTGHARALAHVVLRDAQSSASAS